MHILKHADVLIMEQSVVLDFPLSSLHPTILIITSSQKLTIHRLMNDNTYCYRRPGFHRVMTSLSKIYSRAKAANKGKAGTNSAINSPTGPNISDGPSSTPVPVNRSNLKSTTSIFQPTPSEDEVVRGGGGVLSGALASFTGKNTNNNPNRNGGVASIYFGNRNQATDQYLTVKPKLPSRVSSDPIRVFKQAEVMAEEHKGKTWSNDIFPKTLKSWPTTSDKSNVSGSSAPDSEKSVRLYDFSSTPTGVVAGSSSDGKKPSPKHSKHSSGQGSPLGSSAGSVRTMQSGPAGKKTSEGSTPGSGGDSSQRSSAAAAAAGQVAETQGPDNPLLISGLFKVRDACVTCLLILSSFLSFPFHSFPFSVLFSSLHSSTPSPVTHSHSFIYLFPLLSAGFSGFRGRAVQSCGVRSHR